MRPESLPADHNEHQQAIRKLALAAALRIVRARQNLRVEDAAEQAGGMGHMTWRRLEAGETVRPRTYAQLDNLFKLHPGTISQAVADDDRMVSLARQLEIDTSPVDEGGAAPRRFVEELANIRMNADDSPGRRIREYMSKNYKVHVDEGAAEGTSDWLAGHGRLAGTYPGIDVPDLLKRLLTGLVFTENRGPAANELIEAGLKFQKELHETGWPPGERRTSGDQ